MALRVALVHDWLTGMRGGERVLEAFFEVFPEADLFTLIYQPGTVTPLIENHRIKTSFIQRLPFVKKHYRLYLPLFPMAIERLDLTGYDLVISLSHCVAKGVITPPGSMHICYIFTPMRYIWDRFNDYFGPGRAPALKRAAFSAIAHYLRVWDTSSAERVDRFIAISRYIAGRVGKYYGRDAGVIYPPVDLERFSLSKSGPEDFYLIVSAFAPYKRLDIAVRAFNSMGKRLVVAGSGQDGKKLRAMAGPNIEFLGSASDEKIASLYSRCRALIFPGEEDFGITPLEAMASGRPVIAYGAGGALETVVPLFRDKDASTENHDPTGLFFFEQTKEALIDAITLFEKNIKRFSPGAARERAGEFSLEDFRNTIRDTIENEYEDFLRTGKKCSKNTPRYSSISSF